MEWLFAPGAGSVTITLFLFSLLVIGWLPMTDDEKLLVIKGSILVLPILYFFVDRCDVLLCLLDWLLSMLSFIVLYVLSVVIFSMVCHALAGVAIDSDRLGITARIVSSFYVWAGVRLVRKYGGVDTSALKTIWLSWLITPPAAERLLDRRGKMLLEELMEKREMNISHRGNN